MVDAPDERITALERAFQVDPGGEAFPALAELYRRDGRLADAERVALRGLDRSPDSLAGRCVLLLVLADLGRSAELRRRLEAWADAAVGARAVPLASELSESEFDRAFESAELELAELVTPDSVAEEAALRVDEPFAGTSPLEAGRTFATRTMAELLEQQGDARGAARIRATLDTVESTKPSAARRPAEKSPAATIATLERWLHNLRRVQS